MCVSDGCSGLLPHASQGNTATAHACTCLPLASIASSLLPPSPYLWCGWNTRTGFLTVCPFFCTIAALHCHLLCEHAMVHTGTHSLRLSHSFSPSTFNIHYPRPSRYTTCSLSLFSLLPCTSLTFFHTCHASFCPLWVLQALGSSCTLYPSGGKEGSYNLATHTWLEEHTGGQEEFTAPCIPPGGAGVSHTSFLAASPFCPPPPTSLASPSFCCPHSPIDSCLLPLKHTSLIPYGEPSHIWRTEDFTNAMPVLVGGGGGAEREGHACTG